MIDRKSVVPYVCTLAFDRCSITLGGLRIVWKGPGAGIRASYVERVNSPTSSVPRLPVPWLL